MMMMTVHHEFRLNSNLITNVAQSNKLISFNCVFICRHWTFTAIISPGKVNVVPNAWALWFFCENIKWMQTHGPDYNNVPIPWMRLTNKKGKQEKLAMWITFKCSCFILKGRNTVELKKELWIRFDWMVGLFLIPDWLEEKSIILLDFSTFQIAYVAHVCTAPFEFVSFVPQTIGRSDVIYIKNWEDSY